MSSQPVTEAGKRLLAAEVGGTMEAMDAMDAALGRHWGYREAILAIEHEAQEQTLRRVREAVQRRWRHTEYGKYAIRDLDAVLAAIAGDAGGTE